MRCIVCDLVIEDIAKYGVMKVVINVGPNMHCFVCLVR